jgi:hypothetical protein
MHISLYKVKTVMSSMSNRKIRFKEVNGIQSFKVRSGADESVLDGGALASKFIFGL